MHNNRVMKTHTTPTGIELLMPQVPRCATNISFQQAKCGGNIKYRLLYRTRIKWTRCRWMYVDSQYKQLSILGTCWREGDKLVCDFDPSPILHERVVSAFKTIVSSEKARLRGYYNHLDTQLKEWGITIDEGFKRVIIKVN